VVDALTTLTIRPPIMMTELRSLWLMMDTNDIRIRPRYVRSATNIWPDSMSRVLDRDDGHHNPRIFNSLQQAWGLHSVDRFAPPWKTNSYRVSTPDGATPRTRTSTAYTYRTRNSIAKATIATLWTALPLLALNSANVEHRPRSFPPTGPISCGSNNNYTT
jgi:hypothetical protein